MRDTLSYHARLQQIYDQLWIASKEPLLRGEVKPYLLPGETSQHWGLSLIMYLQGECANTLLSMSDQLSRWTGREHIFHTRRSLHTTVCTLEFYRSPVKDDDECVHLYVEILTEICQKFAPLRIHYRGLTASQTSILAQGWPLDDSLQHLRLAFRNELRKRGLLQGPEQANVREIAHASLIAFSGSFVAPHQCVSLIEEQRDTDFGIASASTLALVRYQRAALGVEPITLAKVPLLRPLSM